MTSTTAPLAEYRIVGLTENAIRRGDGTTAAGGTCWHCGAGIRYEVIVQHTTTGERHPIGRDCAMRVGMSRAELRDYLASFYAEERAARSAVSRAEAAAREAQRDAVLGAHGTVERLGHDCSCDECRAVAPHGHRVRFDLGCRCDECVAGAIEFYDGKNTAHLIVADRLVLCSLTGDIVDAKIVSTRYGTRWCVNDGAEWLPVEPARRSTLARKGYTEAEIPVLMWTGKSRDDGRPYYKPVMPLAAPFVDTHGERF